MENLCIQECTSELEPAYYGNTELLLYWNILSKTSCWHTRRDDRQESVSIIKRVKVEKCRKYGIFPISRQVRICQNSRYGDSSWWSYPYWFDQCSQRVIHTCWCDIFRSWVFGLPTSWRPYHLLPCRLRCRKIRTGQRHKLRILLITKNQKEQQSVF